MEVKEMLERFKKAGFSLRFVAQKSSVSYSVLHNITNDKPVRRTNLFVDEYGRLYDLYTRTSFSPTTNNTNSSTTYIK